MTKEPFEKMDSSWMEALKKARLKKVPPKILEGFSASVESRIRERQAKEAPAPAEPKRIRIPVWAPAFAVLIVASVVVLRGGLERPWMAPADSGLSEEVAVMRELGVWDDEDEAAAGINGEVAAQELEIER